ncbi:MAG: low temperature requirement protein A [Bacteroidota bacterium]|nr:low temperature requirement protein A [Bacteroidota bacterium]
MKTTKSILADGDHPVSFAELFFDLVFVFAITQVVHLIHGSFDLVHVGRAILVFWLVWWAWTQFSWALNAADTRNRLVQLGTLLATAIAFFMAVSVPESFGKSALWFATAYVGGRSIGLIIYLWITWANPSMRSAVRLFASLSLAGLLAVMVGGYLGGNIQYWCWGLAISFDVIAAIAAGGSESWNLHPGHFSERHGLFVLIALGETLIIAASAVTEEYWNGYLLLVSLLSGGLTCCLWWIYFFRAKEKLEHAMASKRGGERSQLARDVYSLLHFPLLCGLIIYAYAIEEAMLHSVGAMTLAARTALSLGILIFSFGIVLTNIRATGKLLTGRTIMTMCTAAAVYFFGNLQTWQSLAIALVGLLLVCVWEEIAPLDSVEHVEGVRIE